MSQDNSPLDCTVFEAGEVEVTQSFNRFPLHVFLVVTWYGCCPPPFLLHSITFLYVVRLQTGFIGFPSQRRSFLGLTPERWA